MKPVVVYRSSETLTNQSDVVIRSDDRFLNLVVDSDSIVSKILQCRLFHVLLFSQVLEGEADLLFHSLDTM